MGFEVSEVPIIVVRIMYIMSSSLSIRYLKKLKVLG